MLVRDVKYFRSYEIHELTEDDYKFLKESGMMSTFYPEATGIYEDDVPGCSIDDNPDGIGWPYEMGSEYIDKIDNVTKDHFDTFTGCLHDWESYYNNSDCIRCKNCLKVKEENKD